MTDKKYNILWIDDEHEKLGGFKLQARQNGIILKAFKSKDAGIAELQVNYSSYDVILLDAKFFENEEDVAGSEDLKALNLVKDALLQLPKKFEFFVLTGQAELFADKTFNTFFPKYYSKGVDADISRLFADLKNAADKQTDTQIRHKYQRVFEVCTDKYIGTSSANMLLSLLKIVEGYEDSSNTENHLTTVRKVVEELFKAFKQIGVIPNEVTETNDRSKFLSGQHPKYTFNDEILDKTTSLLLKTILQITNDGSHTRDNLSLNVDKYIKQQGTPFLFNSAVFQLLDVLIWFKNYADAHPDIEKNKLLATPLQTDTSFCYEGTIAQDTNKNYYCGEYLLDYRKVSSNYAIGDTIKITEIAENTNTRTKHLYPKYTNTFTKITS